jgi:hypothetical protein
VKARAKSLTVMPGLVPGIHVFLSNSKNVDGRDEPGHDEVERMHLQRLSSAQRHFFI